MVIEVNKDIDRYKESVVLGLTARQLIYSIISVLMGGGIVLLVYPYVRISLFLWLHRLLLQVFIPITV